MVGGDLKACRSLDDAHGGCHRAEQWFGVIVVERYCFAIVSVLLKAPVNDNGMWMEFVEEMVGGDRFVG